MRDKPYLIVRKPLSDGGVPYILHRPNQIKAEEFIWFSPVFAFVTMRRNIYGVTLNLAQMDKLKKEEREKAKSDDRRIGSP